MIYNIGSINIDYVYRVPHLVTPGETLASHSLLQVLGGKGANQSVAAVKAGAVVSHVGRVNNNDVWALEQLANLGVNIDLVEASDGPSGHAIIQVDDSGENSIVLFGGANQQLTQPQLQKALSSATTNDWVLVQNECNGLPDVFELAAAKNLSVAFNPAPMSKEVLSLPLNRTHCLIMNEVEAADIVGVGSDSIDDKVSALIQRFPDSIIALTLGAAGVKLIQDSNVVSISSPKVKAVDTTGAGDTFVGYFVAGLVEGQDPQTAAIMACHAAALSVTIEGATPSIPSRVDVASFKKQTEEQ